MTKHLHKKDDFGDILFLVYNNHRLRDASTIYSERLETRDNFQLSNRTCPHVIYYLKRIAQFLLAMLQQQSPNAIVGNKCFVHEKGFCSTCICLSYSRHPPPFCRIHVIYERSLEKIHVWQAYSNWRERIVWWKRDYVASNAREKSPFEIMLTSHLPFDWIVCMNDTCVSCRGI